MPETKSQTLWELHQEQRTSFQKQVVVACDKLINHLKTEGVRLKLEAEALVFLLADFFDLYPVFTFCAINLDPPSERSMRKARNFYKNNNGHRVVLKAHGIKNKIKKLYDSYKRMTGFAELMDPTNNEE